MMEKLLTNTYVQSLWTLFVQNSIVLGVDILGSLPSEKVLRDTILAFWQANIDANVPEKDLPAATLDSFYQLVESQLSDALSAAKANL
jgi:hypothetical protein